VPTLRGLEAAPYPLGRMRSIFIPAKSVSPGSYVVGFRNPRLAAQAGLRSQPPSASNVGVPYKLTSRPIQARSDWNPTVIASGVPYTPEALGRVGVTAYNPTPVCGQPVDPGPYDLWPSQVNMSYELKRALPYGRPLRGLGAVPDSPVAGDTWSGNDPALLRATQEDDVAGNGIFDGEGTPPTTNAGYGVFQANYSLPGYVYREKPGHVSEVVDRRTGNPVMFLTAGGGTLMRDFYEAYEPHLQETVQTWSTKPVNRPFALPATEHARVLDGLGAIGALGQAPSSDGSTMVTSAVVGLLAGAALAMAYEIYLRMQEKKSQW